MNDYKQEFIDDILNVLMSRIDDVDLIEMVRSGLILRLYNYDVIKKERALTTALNEDVNATIVKKFVAAKTVEGRTKRTIRFYLDILKLLFRDLNNKPYTEITSEDVYLVLAKAKAERNCSSVTVNNIRRGISAFYTWLFKNEFIKKNPMFKVGKIKVVKINKKALSLVEIERVWEEADVRDRAIFEVLLGSGMRVGELVRLNRQDINYTTRQVVVFGKGQKERICFLTQTAVYYLERYLATRKDDNEALIVTLDSPFARIKISGIEIRMRELGRRAGVALHPHKLRRTAATIALERGMSLTSVQMMLGHNDPGTTMIYLDLSRANLKHEHDKYLG